MLEFTPYMLTTNLRILKRRTIRWFLLIKWFLSSRILRNPLTSTAIKSKQDKDFSTLQKLGTDFQINKSCECVRFIHIGKCGGTSIRYQFREAGVNLRQFHLEKPLWNSTSWYFFWIRNPIKRFVSAFNYSKAIVDFDITLCDKRNLTLENCPAPRKILNRIECGFAFDPCYDALVHSFKSANELAESLSSSNKDLRAKANALMTHRQEHLFKGLGWYLDNGLFIEMFHQQIFFVGRLENFDDDFRTLSELVGLPTSNENKIPHKRASVNGLSRELSETAIGNIRKFYASTDYKTLKILKDRRFIDQEVYDQYSEY